MSKLYGYQISGQTVGIDIESWENDDLNNNKPFIIINSGDTIPSGYVDISNIENWDTIGLNVANDYLVVKFEIKNLVDQTGWSGLTNNEKNIAIKYYAYPDDISAITHLMTTMGMSQQNAQVYLVQQWHRHHAGVINACKKRWYYVKFIIPLFLSFDDAEDLFDTVQQLIYEYTEMGRLGKINGDKNDGIMDYIHSANGFAGQGLKENNYTLLQGDWNTLITMMNDVFVNGVYNKYDYINMD